MMNEEQFGNWMHGRIEMAFEEKESADGGGGLLLAIHIFRGMPCMECGICER